MSKLKITTFAIFFGVLAFVSVNDGFAVLLVEYENMRGNPVFVTEKSAIKLLERGYLVEKVETVKTTADLQQRWVHTPVLDSRAGSSAGTIPFYEFDFPKHIKLGDVFEINIPYTYVKFDPEDGEVDEVIKPFGPNPAISDNVGTFLYLHFPDDWVWLNPDNSTYLRTDYYNPQWDKTFSHISKFILYNSTPPQNINLKFMLNDTISYPHNDFLIGIDNTGTHYFMNPTTHNTWEISDVEVRPNFAPGFEPQPPYPKKFIGEHGTFGTLDPNKSWPDMDSMADDLENLNIDWTFGGTFGSIEEMLRDSFSSAWVDEFLKKYPQYSANFILPSLDWFLPEAYGALSYSLVRGDVEIEEIQNRFVDPSVTLEFCVYDKDLSSPSNPYTLLTKPNGKNACDDVENGSFSILTTNVDPDGDNTKPDFIIGVFLKNETVLLKESMSELKPVVFYSSAKNNHSSFMVSFTGSEKISIPQSVDFFKSYSVFKISSDTLTKFDNIGMRNLPVLTVYYDPSYNANTPLCTVLVQVL